MVYFLFKAKGAVCKNRGYKISVYEKQNGLTSRLNFRSNAF